MSEPRLSIRFLEQDLAVKMTWSDFGPCPVCGESTTGFGGYMDFDGSWTDVYPHRDKPSCERPRK